MEITTILMWIVASVALIAALVAVWKSGGTVSQKLTDMEKAVKEAYNWVVAAEETWSHGEITNAEKHAFVLEKIRAVFPDFSEELLNSAIKAAVGLLKIGLNEKIKKPMPPMEANASFTIPKGKNL